MISEANSNVFFLLKILTVNLTSFLHLKAENQLQNEEKKKRICYGFNNIICFIEFLKPKQFSVWLWIMNYEFWLYRHFLAILAEKFRQEFTDFYWWMLVNQCLRCLSLWICSFRFLVAFDRLFGRASLLDLNLTSVGAFDSRSIWALDRKNAIGWKAGRNVIDFETLW